MPQRATALSTMTEFGQDVHEGLTKKGQKELPSKYLYDAVGSALFEVITELPEYGVTRADWRVLETYADDIVGTLEDPVVVAELGSGSGRKTRFLLEAIAKRAESVYFPIDISAAAIERCEAELGSIPNIEFRGVVGDYLHGIKDVREHRSSDEHLFVLFLGGTIGNFDREPALEFLRQLRGALHVGDSLLLATDLIKEEERLIAAYDDPVGVTAAFNRNILARINRELDGDIDLDQFEHVALFDNEERRIEMHLRSRRDQVLRIPGADLVVALDEGETIWTESSHKFLPEEPKELAKATGFRCERQWIDKEWPFAENLFVAE